MGHARHESGVVDVVGAAIDYHHLREGAAFKNGLRDVCQQVVPSKGQSRLLLGTHVVYNVGLGIFRFELFRL